MHAEFMKLKCSPRVVLATGGLVFSMLAISAPAQDADRTFYLSFDAETLVADHADGNASPVSQSGSPVYVDGMHGKALQLNAHVEARYDEAGNLTVPGAVSLWVRPDRERDGNNTMFMRTGTGGGAGYTGMQDLAAGQDLQFFLLNVPGISTKNIINPFPWDTNQWHHIALNIETNQATLYLDGVRQGETQAFERPLAASDFADFLVGGTTKINGYTIDELQIYSRPLTLAEIVEPLMKPASSEARKATQRAISSGSPRRPAGIWPMIDSRTFSGTAMTISVAM